MFRGLRSALGILGVPLGSWWCGGIDSLAGDERRERGCVLILPGIEGRGWLNLEIARGIADAGNDGAIEVADWTTGAPWLLLYHLCSPQRHRRQAARIAESIRAYQARYPGRPVYLVGHSAGGAIALFVLEALGADHRVAGAILLGAAISPNYDLRTALLRVEHGIWNFSSRYDGLFLRLGACIFGTLDRKHGCAAGAVGFEPPHDLSPTDRAMYQAKLHEVRYEWAMLRAWNFGGHFGCVNREFIAQRVAPLMVQGTERSA